MNECLTFGYVLPGCTGRGGQNAAAFGCGPIYGACICCVVTAGEKQTVMSYESLTMLAVVED